MEQAKTCQRSFSNFLHICENRHFQKFIVLGTLQVITFTSPLYKEPNYPPTNFALQSLSTIFITGSTFYPLKNHDATGSSISNQNKVTEKITHHQMSKDRLLQ